MSMVIYPKLSIRHESDGGLPRSQIFSILCDKKMQPFKNVAVDVVNYSRCSIVGIWPSFTFGFFNGSSFPVVVDGDLTE